MRIIDVRADLDLSSLDGKFQTFGTISLLTGHDVPFRDFPLYLGAGVSHAAWLSSLLFGSNVLAVQQAAIALSSLTFAGMLVFFMRVAGVRAGLWPAGLAVAALIFVAVPGLAGIDLSTPGASLLGVRAAAVAIAGAAVLFFETNLRDRPRYEWWGRGFCWGVVGGGLLLWSNDFGTAGFVALGLALPVLLIVSNRGLAPLLVQVGTFVLASTVAVALLLAMLGTSMGVWFENNYIATAGDQWWLFPPWEDARRAFSPLDVVLTALGVRPFLYQPVEGAIIIASVVICTVFLIRLVLAWRAPSETLAALGVAVLTAWGGALVATLGGHFEARYWGALVLAAPFVALTLLSMPNRLLKRQSPDKVGSTDRSIGILYPRSARMPPVSGRTRMVVFVGIAAWVGLAAQASLLQTRVGEIVTGLVAPSKISLDLGGWRAGLSADQVADTSTMQQIGRILDECQVPADERLVESYPSILATLIEADRRPQAFSIIHILGADAREAYRRSMVDKPPLLVASIAPDYSPWAQWLVRARAFWYDPVFDDYWPVARSDQHTVWLRKAANGSPVEHRGICRIERVDPNRVRLSFRRVTGAGGWGRARVQYHSGPSGDSIGRPFRTLVTVTTSTDDGMGSFYGVPSQSTAEMLSFAAIAPTTTIMLRSAPDASNLTVTGCEVDFISLPEMRNLPRLGERTDLLALVRRQACAGVEGREARIRP